MKPELMHWLQHWYADHSDRDWEHGNGIEIGTLDNPGWRLRVDLSETELAGQPFERTEMDRTENDWVHCWVAESRFQGACGPYNLLEMLDVFRRWVEMRSTPK